MQFKNMLLFFTIYVTIQLQFENKSQFNFFLAAKQMKIWDYNLNIKCPYLGGESK